MGTKLVIIDINDEIWQINLQDHPREKISNTGQNDSTNRIWTAAPQVDKWTQTGWKYVNTHSARVRLYIKTICMYQIVAGTKF